MHTKTIAAALLVTATAVAFGTSAQAAPQQPAAGDQFDVQIVTTDGSSSLVHTIRHNDGTWQNFGRLEGHSGVVGLTSTLLSGEEDLFFQEAGANGPHLTHFIRHADGTWNFAATTPAPLGSVDGLTSTAVGGALTLVALKGGALQMSTLGNNGVWSAWSAVPTGDRSIRSVSIAANAGIERGVLHVVELTADGKTVVDYDRAANGVWSAGSETPTDPNPGGDNVATEVSAAQVATGLQVAIVQREGGFPSVYHAILHDNGVWDPFRNLVGALPAVNGEAVHVAVTNWPAPFDDELQLVYTTSTGDMWHTIRYWDGTWQPLGNVEGAAGNVTAGQVTIAGYTF